MEIEEVIEIEGISQLGEKDRIAIKRLQFEITKLIQVMGAESAHRVLAWAARKIATALALAEVTVDRVLPPEIDAETRKSFYGIRPKNVRRSELTAELDALVVCLVAEYGAEGTTSLLSAAAKDARKIGVL